MIAPTPALDRQPPDWGQPLTGDDYASLTSSWITREIAYAAMLRRVDPQQGREVIGQKGNRDCAGILIPYYWPGEGHPFNYRLRRDNPEWTEGKDGKPKPDRKYLGPPKSGNRLYIPPGVTLEQLADVTIPVAVVEGEKKALALWRLANHEVVPPRFVPIAIAGVWNWRGVVGKTGGANGERQDVKGPIADLSRIAWVDRKVFIVFDTNVHTNDDVKWARKGICWALGRRQAKVDLVNLPEDCGVNGVDDLLAAWGPARVLDLFEKAVSGARLEVVRAPQFDSRPEGMFRVTGQGEKLSQFQLTNYQAAIVSNTRVDDGVEVRREFEIQSELFGSRQTFSISAPEFARMDWPIERLGSGAITFPNQKDYARTAIQWYSLGAEERCVYAHSGWRELDGQWIFLHSGGAIGNSGAVQGLDVRLPSTLSKYELRLPPDPDVLASAIRASLQLVDLGPPSITFPLLAATCRAVLGDADFALHLAGETGAFKSELAALHQQHFGAGMDRLHLPGTWSSTGNSLESLAFHAKDTLLVIDDFAPQGSVADVSRYHAAADRVFRAAGNHAGRGRLDSTAKLREAKPPRALILSTGEEIPRGHSVRARLLILEIPKGAIKPANLSECQRNAGQGLYAVAMGAFVQWLAGSFGERQTAFKTEVAKHRASSLGVTAHARTPEIVGNLQGAFELYLAFALASGLIDDSDRVHYASRCQKALSEAAAAQGKHHAATEPTARFLDIVRSLIGSGRAHLESRNGGEPDCSPGSCGWRHGGDGWLPLGDCIGWIDGDDVYLEPTVSYRAAQVMSRDIGEPLAVSPTTLRKRLHEKKFLTSTDSKRETLTVRRTIGPSQKDVLHLRRSTILPVTDDDSEDAL